MCSNGFRWDLNPRKAFRDLYFCSLQKARVQYLEASNTTVKTDWDSESDISTYQLFEVLRGGRRAPPKPVKKKWDTQFDEDQEKLRRMLAWLAQDSQSRKFDFRAVEGMAKEVGKFRSAVEAPEHLIRRVDGPGKGLGEGFGESAAVG